MDIPGFYFCICPDSTLSRLHMEELARQTGWNPAMMTFWADEGLDGKFWNALTMQDFSGTKKFLLLRQANTLLADDWKKLSSALSTPHGDVLPVLFLEMAWEKGKPKIPAVVQKLKCFEFAKKKNWEFSSPGLTPENIKKFLETEGLKYSLKFSAPALNALSAAVTLNVAAVDNVLRQLKLLAGDDTILPEHVAQLTTYTPELKIFDLVRHIQHGRSKDVWTILQQEDDGGEGLLFPLLGLLVRDTRTMWQIVAGENPFLYGADANFKVSLAKKLGYSQLANLFSCIMQAEYVVKNGEKSPLASLENFLIEIMQIYSPVRRGA